MGRPHRIDWSTPAGEWTASEPTLAEVTAHAQTLAIAYNEPRNGELMGHGDRFDEADVVAHYRLMQEEGARTFLLFHDGLLVGDADLRGVADGAAEVAIMVAAPASQGKGLGTRFALMICSFGFAQLGLHHLYASIAPANVASRRVFEKLGFAVDSGVAARTFAEAEDDLVMSIDRPTFERQHPLASAEVRATERDAPRVLG